MSVKIKSDVRYELVVPDGGWGYMICLAGVINLITVTGFVSSFGMIYGDFMREIGLESTALTMLSGLNSVSLALGGFVTSPLQKIMTMRQMTLFAVILFNFGVICVLFVKSVIPLYLCVGIMQGLGFGIIFNLTYAMVNEYFVEKRLFAYSVMKTMIAIFSMFAPQFVKLTLAEYGFRGTILMLSAVSLHSFIAVALMQPVTWHMKKVEKQHLEEETRVLLIVEKNDGTGPKSECTNLTCQPMEIKTPGTENSVSAKSSWLVKKMNDLFDITLMKSLILSNVSWGLALAAVADVTFLSLMPQALNSYNWSKDNIALALSLVGLGDLVGRGCFIFISKWLTNVGNQELFIGGVIISVVARISFICSPSVTLALVFITLYGVGRCFVALFLPMVISEVVGTEKFTAAMGFIMVVVGVMNMGGGPIIGAIRDYTHSYDITFWILAGFLIVSILSWTIELIYKRRQQSKKDNE